MPEPKLLEAKKRMQDCLEQLGISLSVCWAPDKAKAVHGEILESTLFIYDASESEAWNTFTHEVCEYKLQGVTRPYRLLVNSLIEVIEKSVYSQKEDFLESLPKILETVQKVKR